MKNELYTWIHLLLLLVAVLFISSAGTTRHDAYAQTLPPGDLGLPPPDRCHSLGAAGTPYVTGINCRLILVDAYPRAYIVFVPPTVQDPAPVVFMFHGSSGDGYQYLQISGWREKAVREGLIAVFPTALRYCKEGFPCVNGGQAGWTTKWHNYHLPEDEEYDFNVQLPGYVVPDWPADDVTFTRMMIADLRNEANGLDVDTERIYASGFSSGAGLAARLAVEVSDQFAAVGYTGGGLVEVTNPINLPPPPEAYVPVFAAIGTDDPGILDTVGEPGPLPLDPDEFLDIDRMQSFFIQPHLDAYEHQYSAATLQPFETVEGTHYTTFRWQANRRGESDHVFQLALLEGLEHKFPNGCHSKNPHGFVAADMIWEFFQSASEYTGDTVAMLRCIPESG